MGKSDEIFTLLDYQCHPYKSTSWILLLEKSYNGVLTLKTACDMTLHLNFSDVKSGP